jgi:hypothetical protein
MSDLPSGKRNSATGNQDLVVTSLLTLSPRGLNIKAWLESQCGRREYAVDHTSRARSPLSTASPRAASPVSFSLSSVISVFT